MCDICNNSGYIYENLPDGSRGIRLCDCVLSNCKCNKEYPYLYLDGDKLKKCYCAPFRLKFEKVKYAFSNSGLPKKFYLKFLDDFSTKTESGNEDTELNKLRGIAATYIEKYNKNNPRGMLFYGNSGNGKTLLAAIILNELIFQKAINGKFVSISFSFFNKLRETYNSLSEDYGQAMTILDDLIKTDLLILDDFGIQRNTPWELEMLYNLIDRRYEEEAPIIITTNNKPEDFKGIYYNRIYSRILEMCRMIEFNVPDYRERYAIK